MVLIRSKQRWRVHSSNIRQTHQKTIALTTSLFYGLSFDKPSLPPSIFHNYCFQFLLSITIVTKEIEDNAYSRLTVAWDYTPYLVSLTMCYQWFFPRVRRGASSTASRNVFGRRPKTRKTSPKQETAHEKPLAFRVSITLSHPFFTFPKKWCQTAAYFNFNFKYYLSEGKKKLLGYRYHSLPTHRLIRLLAGKGCSNVDDMWFSSTYKSRGAW